ncbi:thiamine pyrophosphate-binding protein [Corynebacterium hylobatis]|uniref:acetolactate synthase n=1 Tax=Corynebacterium hylobatis TaxID=1859290 RepID=A0A430HY81_9CORY|nr:thiamine pyrophosphate-binding protein [Corynebacterium hylobatis]RSZ63178.1 thiamine pyrophosphate-binding protein [Corynebacterium hylobatis]
MYTVSEAVARTLASNTDTFFGLMGNGNAWLVDALERLGTPMVPVRHEVAAVASADSYHRVTRKLAVATTTYGPGFTNVITALTDAALSHTPLVYVVGSAPAAAPRDFDIDQDAMSTAAGAHVLTVGPDNTAAITQQAVDLALETLRPVVLSIPYDLADQPVTEAGAQAPAPAQPAVRAVPVVDAALEKLVGATHPLIVAGRGARAAAADLIALAELLRADVATTAPARGTFPTGEHRYRDLGISGGFAAEGAAREMQRADVVLVVGAGLNQFTTSFGNAYGEHATIIQIDIAETATNPRVDLFLSGNATDVIPALLDGLRSREYIAGKRQRLETDPTARALGEELAPDGRLDPRSLMVRLNRTIPADRLIVSDGGHFIGWANMYFDVQGPDHLIMVGTAFQSIGLGFPSAPGVATAAGERTTVLVTGDGGGLMGIADAESFIRTAHRGVVIVVNDAAYGAEIHQYGANSRGLAEKPMLIPEINFAGMLSPLGAQGTVVRTLDDLADFEEWIASESTGTYVLDCRVSRSIVAPYMNKALQKTTV